jgi:IS5 family transposase
MRHFAGIELGDDRVPDETTILNFRRLLETHALTEKLFAGLNRQLADQGITLRAGTLSSSRSARTTCCGTASSWSPRSAARRLAGGRCSTTGGSPAVTRAGLCT